MMTQSKFFTDAPNGASGDSYQDQKFLFERFLSKVNTCIPVRVVAVDAQGIAPVGFVTVVPLVNQLTVDGRSQPNPTLHNVPYFRLQGGKNAVVIDPAVNDIGIAVFSQRDISAVKRTRKTAPCGSLRMHDIGDALYIGGFLNDTPQQYIHFAGEEIRIHSPSKIVLDAPHVEITGSTKLQDIVFENHVHGGVERGGSTTNNPQNP